MPPADPGPVHSSDRRLCLVVPCYNEAKRLNTGAFRAFLATCSHTRLLFVDDGSTDTTMDVLDKLTAGFAEGASVLRCEVNGGKAEAVRLGMLHAMERWQPQFAGFWDADLATPLDAVLPLLSVLDTDPAKDMVFGARVKLLGRHVERKASRHYLGRVFATVVSSMLRLPIYDTQCGAKIFRVTPETKRIFADRFVSRWVFDVEIIARYIALRGHDLHTVANGIYEYPLETWRDVAGSKVKPVDFATALIDVLRIERKYLR